MRHYDKIKLSEIYDKVVDATHADNLELEPVWSVTPCEFCVPIEVNKRAKPKQTDPDSDMVYSIVNQVFCPFNYVRIEGKDYHRSRVYFHGMTKKQTKKAIKHKHRCHDCGVPPGFVHHVNCDCEQCPRCEGQLISCRCGTTGLGETDMSKFAPTKKLEFFIGNDTGEETEEDILIEHIGV